MRIKFAHIADVHLCQVRYGHEWRGEDFRDAWLDAVDAIIAEKVDFVTFGGDATEKAFPHSYVPMSQFIEGLDRLRQANIDVVGIDGNHDVEYPGQSDSFLRFLADRGHIVLVDQETGPHFMTGTFAIHGIPYSGHATVADMVRFAESKMPKGRINILLMHAGLEGILPGHHTGTFKLEEARQLLKPKVDLLLLGHIHKPYQVDGWIYNPGSVEACDSKQALWQDRGLLIFEVDTETKKHTVKTIRYNNRHWLFIQIDTTGKQPHEIELEYLGLLGNSPILAERIVHLTLRGQMDFPLSSLTLDSSVAPKLLLTKNETWKTVQTLERTTSSKDEIELEVFGQLTSDPAKAKKVMQLALAGAKPETILEVLC